MADYTSIHSGSEIDTAVTMGAKINSGFSAAGNGYIPKKDSNNNVVWGEDVDTTYTFIVQNGVLTIAEA